MSGTYHSENILLGNLFGGLGTSLPSTWYIGLGLSTGTPTESAPSGFVEPSGGAYARVAVTNNSSNFNAASNGQLTNSTTITFPESTATWGYVNYIGFFDALAGGNLWFFESITSKQIVASTTVIFSPNAITISNRN